MELLSTLLQQEGYEVLRAASFESRTLLAQVNALLRMKYREEALRENETEFKAAFDYALDAMLIADERVTLAGGRLTIESATGAGTTVLVHIPILPDSVEAAPHEEAASIPG